MFFILKATNIQENVIPKENTMDVFPDHDSWTFKINHTFGSMFYLII